MRRTLAACAVLLFAPSAFAADDYPHVVLKNEKLKFKLYEADAAKGFYRGTRFDHAGVFGEVEFAGHKVFGPWKDKHDPTNHDDIVGPCGEFGIDSPLGYADAKAGETFLKIGVGELEKPKEAKYSFANKYKVVKPLEWERQRMLHRGCDLLGALLDAPIQVWRTQQKANGYGYSYQKLVVLNLSDPRVIISHTLKNTGEKRMVTDFYNHNFFNVDDDPVGPNYSFAFAAELKAKDLKGKFGELVELKAPRPPAKLPDHPKGIFGEVFAMNGSALYFKEKVPNGVDVMATLTGFDAKDEKHRTFEMRHAPSGVTVRVEHSYPFAKFNVWGIKTTICPEPFMAIDLKPGEEVKWNIAYTFTHEPPKKK